LAFNLAHTSGLVACAVARAGAVGVDVELPSVGNQAFDDTQRFFSQAEVDALRTLPPAVRDDRFFDYWTLKEAYVKGRGMGLSLPFDQFTIDLNAQSEPSVSVAPEFDNGCRWQFLVLRLLTGHRLAAAVRLPSNGGAFDFKIRAIVPFGSDGLVNDPGRDEGRAGS
jgi:4'-phosphopantetheinyl transferase